MDYKDYYKTLGVDRGADDKAIKTAYRRLARKYHPDVNRGNAERFKEISEAYTVLGDPEKRKHYDTLGPDWERYAQAEAGAGAAGGRSPFEGRPSGGSGGRFTQEGDLGGFSDFFRTIFGDMSGFRRGHPSGGATEFEFADLGDLGGGGFGGGKGSDVEAGIQLSLEEAFQGARKSISLELDEPCPECGGSGNVNRRPCPRCHGSGWTKATRNLDVKIPAGVDTGSRVRVAAEGPGGGSGQRSDRGDLYLRVTVQPHPRFERKGDDLYTDVETPLTVPVLGGEVHVQALDKNVALRLPAGTQNGQTFRLTGLGMPKLTAPDKRGDLFARVRVRLPQTLGDKERRLFEELKETGL